MDSLSQIVLGAAVGEAVLGKKLGNRAMVWGAVAGTLPDMDVLGQYFLSELDNLAFHRGISHSLTATVLGSLFFGWATDSYTAVRTTRKSQWRPRRLRSLSSDLW